MGRGYGVYGQTGDEREFHPDLTHLPPLTCCKRVGDGRKSFGEDSTSIQLDRNLTSHPPQNPGTLDFKEYFPVLLPRGRVSKEAKVTFEFLSFLLPLFRCRIPLLHRILSTHIRSMRVDGEIGGTNPHPPQTPTCDPFLSMGDRVRDSERKVWSQPGRPKALLHSPDARDPGCPPSRARAPRRLLGAVAALAALTDVDHFYGP